MLDGGDALQHFGSVDLRFCRLGRSHLRARLVNELHGRGIHAEAMKDCAGSVEGQFAVGGDSDDLEDQLRSLRDDLVADLRRRRGGEEFLCRFAGLGFGHTEKIAERAPDTIPCAPISIYN